MEGSDQNSWQPWPHGAVGDPLHKAETLAERINHANNVRRFRVLTDSEKNIANNICVPGHTRPPRRQINVATPYPYPPQYHPHSDRQGHPPAALIQRPETEAQKAPKKSIVMYKEAFARCNIKLLTKRIGNGKYSKVYPAKEITSGRMMALKAIDLDELSDDVRTKFLPREVDLWKTLNHKHLVMLLAHYETPNMIFLAMEYGAYGDLLAYVQKHGALEEMLAGLFLSQVLEALAYMHQHGIAHRDVKLENIILFDGFVKLSDFGFITKLKEGDFSLTFCGSKAYSAPELLFGKPYSPFLSDVWSAGVVGFVLATDRMPFNEQLPNRRLIEQQRTKKYTYPKGSAASAECRATIEKMLSYDPNERPTAAECLRLDWIRRPGAKTSQFGGAVQTKMDTAHEQ